MLKIFPHERMINCLVLLNGRDFDASLMGHWIEGASLLVCADAAVEIARAFGREPDWIVGDFDSFALETPVPCHFLHRPSQDHSDSEKALDLAKELGVSRVSIAGIEGDRPDHVLMCLHAAVRSGLDCTLLYRTGVAHIVRAGETLRWAGPVGTTVSTFPLVSPNTVHKRGVKWPMSLGEIALGANVSISNQAEEGFELCVTAGTSWVFFESHDGKGRKESCGS